MVALLVIAAKGPRFSLSSTNIILPPYELLSAAYTLLLDELTDELGCWTIPFELVLAIREDRCFCWCYSYNGNSATLDCVPVDWG